MLIIDFRKRKWEGGIQMRLKKMSPKVVMASIAATMMFGLTCSAEETLQYGQEVEIQTDNGSYKITVDKLDEKDHLYNGDETIKVICVECLVENTDYENPYGQSVLGSYDIGGNAISLLDADGISAEFYNVSASSDDGYELYAMIKPGEKKRVALPFLVPADTENVTVKIDSKYELTQNLDVAGNEAEATQENDSSELQKQIETLESEINELKTENEALRSKVEELTVENEEFKNSGNQQDAVATESTESNTTETAQSGSTYETIYNEYAQKIKDAAPTSGITEMANLANEGVSEMAEYMLHATGTDGQYAAYEEWAGKLYDVYMSEVR